MKTGQHHQADSQTPWQELHHVSRQQTIWTSPMRQLRHCTRSSESTSAVLFPDTLPAQCSASRYRRELWLYSQGQIYKPLSSKAEQTGLLAAGTQQQTTPYTIRGNKSSSREGLHRLEYYSHLTAATGQKGQCFSQADRCLTDGFRPYQELNRGEE